MALHAALIQKLLATNSHVGHRIITGHIKPLISSIRNTLPILDSDKTLISLRSALAFISHVSSLSRLTAHPSFLSPQSHFWRAPGFLRGVFGDGGGVMNDDMSMDGSGSGSGSGSGGLNDNMSMEGGGFGEGGYGLNDNGNVDGMKLEERIRIIKSVGEECIGEEQLNELLISNHEPICFDAFQPSGRMNIALGVMKTINVNKLTSAGCKVKMMIADLPAFLNNKLGGDPKKIEVVGKYFIEIWKAIGINSSGKVEFLWSSEEVYSHANEYWPLVLDIARKNKLPRLVSCCQVEPDEISGAQIMCPCMQCADVLFTKADICQQGMDQREVKIIAREYCDEIKRKNKCNNPQFH